MAGSEYLPWGVALAALGTNLVVLKLATKDNGNVVKKDICKLITFQFSKDIEEVKGDVKELLRRIPKNGG